MITKDEKPDESNGVARIIMMIMIDKDNDNDNDNDNSNDNDNDVITYRYLQDNVRTNP